MCDTNVLATKLDHLTENVSDLKAISQKNRETLQALHVERLKRDAEIEHRLTVTESEKAPHDELHKTVDSRLKAVESIVPAVKAIMWIAAALGLSATGLIWSIITGQVQVLFP